MIEKKPHICHECGSEFYVFPAYEDAGREDQITSWCPYCGSELYELDDDIENFDDYDE